MIYRRKIVFIGSFLLLTFNAFAPERKEVAIPGSHPVEPFRRLISAIGIVETGYDTLAYNPEEEATGYFQIRPIRLEDYNRRTGSSYTMEDMFNYRISERIFLYYASLVGPYDFETIARRWNGSGEQTIAYWQRVKEHL